MAEKIEYKPQPDITPYEVGIIINAIVQAQGNVSREWYDAQSPEIQRHFIIEVE